MKTDISYPPAGKKFLPAGLHVLTDKNGNSVFEPAGKYSPAESTGGFVCTR